MRQLSSTEHQVREQMCAMLYEDYQKSIEQYLMAWVHNQEIARDLCQDTFEYVCRFLLIKETVVQSAAKYKVDLYTTAKYRAFDYLRRQNKPVVYLSQSESEANSQFDEPMTEGLEGWIDLIDLPDDLLQLPPEQRDSLVKYAVGYKQNEIAEQKGKSEAAVSGYMKMGRTNLRNRKSFVVSADLEERRRISRAIDGTINLLLADVIGDLRMLEGRFFPAVIEWCKPINPKEASHLDYELNVLQESDQTLGDLERFLDRVNVKPMRRILIDVENQNRGLLSDTAVLGACGQYLF